MHMNCKLLKLLTVAITLLFTQSTLAFTYHNNVNSYNDQFQQFSENLLIFTENNHGVYGKTIPSKTTDKPVTIKPKPSMEPVKLPKKTMNK